MNKIIMTMAAVLLGAGVAGAEYNPAYYSKMDGLKREALKAAAKECVSSHKQLEYYDLPMYWQYSDVYPEKVNGKTRWWEMYSNEYYYINSGQSASKSFSANKMQREHSVPKSWWKVGEDVEYTPAYSDMWNLYPSDGAANQAKLNYPLGVVSNATFDNNCTKVGTPAYGMGGGAGAVFEPADEYKGDFARSFFYMATVYDDLPWKYTYMFAKNSYPTLQSWAYNMLLQWARQDPVSQKERIRNDAVEKSQGNRNPFVDFPQLAEYIWGNYQGKAFSVKDEGGVVLPPVTGDAELTAPVNDEWIDFGEAAIGSTKASYVMLQGSNFLSAISVRIGGADRSAFVMDTRSVPASSINATGKYMLPIEFTPTEAREYTATLSIYDGGLADQVRVNLRGTGCPVPELKALTAYPASDISETAYTAAWEEASEPVDYYVLYRTRYLAEGVDTDEIECDTNSLRITDRDPGVAESYQVVASRLGFMSPLSNSVMVEASGVDVFDAPTAQIGVLPGAIVVLTDSEVAHLAIYDIAGREIATYENLGHGAKIELAPGAYVVSARELGRPVKILL